jgi:hypothetical protein
MHFCSWLVLLTVEGVSDHIAYSIVSGNYALILTGHNRNLWVSRDSGKTWTASTPGGYFTEAGYCGTTDGTTIFVSTYGAGPNDKVDY